MSTWEPCQAGLLALGQASLRPAPLPMVLYLCALARVDFDEACLQAEVCRALEASCIAEGAPGGVAQLNLTHLRVQGRLHTE